MRAHAMFLVLVLCTTCGASAYGQQVDGSPRHPDSERRRDWTIDPPTRRAGLAAGHRQALTVNPLLLMAGFINAEFERTRGVYTTWGASGTFNHSWFPHSVKALFRVYPHGTALQGVFVGARAGITRAALYDSEPYGVLGVESGFTTFSGRRQRFVSSFGVGINVRVGAGDAIEEGFPSVRVNLGIAF